MNAKSNAVFCLLAGALLAILTVGHVFAQEDVKGSKDHPLFNRMPHYRISYYDAREFDVYDKFRDNRGKRIAVEGHYLRIDYKIKKEMKEKAASETAIIRNFTNAMKKIGGLVLREERREAYMKLEKNGKRTWVHLRTESSGKKYTLYIIEEQEMEQAIVADANSMAADIGNTGRVTLYGIYFDLNKAEVKPESGPTLKEITKLLKHQPDLKIYVVGHTDNVGSFNNNMTLSQARADAVVEVLASKYGVDRKRLASAGVGPLSPVTSNKTEESRALNRRVELVAQ